MHYSANIVVDTCEGTIITLCLFLIDINDMSEGLKSNVKSYGFYTSILFIVNDNDHSESVNKDFKTFNERQKLVEDVLWSQSFDGSYKENLIL